MQPGEHRRLLQNSIDQLVQYTKDWQWQIKFNDKCKILHVGKNNPAFIIIYFMDGRELRCIEVEKLGVFIDKDLKIKSEQHK